MNNVVVLGMSGGVDSSVAACLLQEQGFEVVGVTFRFWAECEARAAAARRTCCSLSDLRDASLVARGLGIEHQVVDLRREFKEMVVDPFVDSYTAGLTPNPCVECNRLLKFPGLLRAADQSGAGRIATGHYARIAEEGGLHRLLRGADPAKDQSYVLYRLDQPTLARLLFPVGGLSKQEVVKKARGLGLEAAGREESQDICFLPDGDYRDFLRERRPEAFLPGFILDREGRILGKHSGIADFTIGQRRGLGVPAPHPLYVIDLDPVRNAVVVGTWEEAEMLEVRAEEVSWISGAPPAEEFAAEAKVRYQMEPVAARVRTAGEGSFRAGLMDPVPAAAPGQSAVLYRSDEVLGGGIIARRQP